MSPLLARGIMFRKVAALAVLALGLAACSTGASGRSASADGGELTVFAAASLNAAFPEIAERVFAADYPHTKVNFSFEGSSSLAEKILAGAPADVFASANTKNMDKVASLAVAPAEFTKNTLRLIVPAGNPASVTDLASASAAKLVVCAPQVPCGAATATLAQHLGVEIRSVSQEQSVTDVRTKVETGEADAGLVYLTDALLAGERVQVVDIPRITEVGTSYMLATLAEAPSPEAARAFVDAVRSPRGQEILAKHGFGTGEGEKR